MLFAYPYTKGFVYYAERNCPLRDLARDDILDALAAAFTASKEIEGLSFLPEKLTFDAKGLPMQMAYYFMSYYVLISTISLKIIVTTFRMSLPKNNTLQHSQYVELGWNTGLVLDLLASCQRDSSTSPRVSAVDVI